MWGHIWDILATFQPHSLGSGDKCTPPCFRVLFGRVQQCYILRDPTKGDFKFDHLQAWVTALSVPSHLFFQQYMSKKFIFFIFRALSASSGGHVPLRPPLGPALQISRNAAQSAASNIIHMTYYDNSRIMQTCPCNVYPLKPHFYIVKSKTREYIFLIFALKIDCGSNEYPQSIFRART